MVRVTISPAGRSATASATGSHGRRSGRRAPRGHQRHRGGGDQSVRRASGERQRRLQQQVAGGLARLGRAPQLGSERPELVAQARARYSAAPDTPSARATTPDLGDVPVAVGCRATVRRRTDRGRRGSCRVRRGAPSAAGADRWRSTAVRRRRRRRRARAPGGRRRPPAAPRSPARTWWRRGSRRCAAADPTDRCGSRSAEPRRPSPADAATAGAALGAHR